MRHLPSGLGHPPTSNQHTHLVNGRKCFDNNNNNCNIILVGQWLHDILSSSCFVFISMNLSMAEVWCWPPGGAAASCSLATWSRASPSPGPAPPSRDSWPRHSDRPFAGDWPPGPPGPPGPPVPALHTLLVHLNCFAQMSTSTFCKHFWTSVPVSLSCSWMIVMVWRSGPSAPWRRAWGTGCWCGGCAPCSSRTRWCSAPG